MSALAASFTQTTRLLRLSTPLGAHTLLAECVRGEESISNGFAFAISALSLDAGIGLRQLLGQPALLELLTTSEGSARPFHGMLSAVELNGANGGMARYTLTLQPWSVFLGRGRDSRVFQDMTVFDILDAVFAPYQGLGKLDPAWRYDVAERGVYPLRSLTTQYQESDLAFAERLMSEEGLFYFFTHEGDPASATLGRHTMVIADHNGAFAPNQQAEVRFTQPGAVMKEDSMDRWRSELRLRTNAVDIRSWDYRTRDLRAAGAAGVQAAGAALAISDAPGAYAWADRSQGARIAENQMQALEAQREVFIGAGTVRTLAPGTTFTLSEHAMGAQAESDFIVTRAVHLMHNNLSADLQGALHQFMGQGPVARAIADEQAASLHGVGKDAGQRPLYRNRIDAIRASLPFKASRNDAHGRLLHPRPTVRGQQSAVVVGPEGSVIHTDRDHRVKVQFHWLRGDASHSRLAHHAPQGQTGATADDRAGTWVRVATPLAPVAGANWGSHALPRVGQEVLVDFLEGNIDRPVIIGALYNGGGARDAQHNQVSQGAGAATGNAPAWFPGDGGAHAHPAILSGIKTQSMQTSARGSGAYSQLVFDDTPLQARIALQRHAGLHQGTAELNLGQLRHQSDNQRLAPAGFGAELKTEHSTALRAGQGLLLSTDIQPGGNGDALDARRAQAQIANSAKLQETLAASARDHQATMAPPAGGAAAEPKDLPAIAQMAHSAEVVDAYGAGASASALADGEAGGAGRAAAFSEPQLQLSAPAGIAAATPASAIFAAGHTVALAAGHDIDSAAQGNLHYTIYGGISLFAYGKSISPDKPNQETGIRLHAASGKFSSQSQSDVTTLTADKTVTVASTAKSVTVAAKQHVLMTAQGAYLKLEGGNIMVHGPGVMAFKAGMKELTGPQSSRPVLPHFPNGNLDLDESKLFSTRVDAAEFFTDPAMAAGAAYVFKRADGTVVEGTLDEHGRTQRLFTEEAEEVTLLVGDGEWEIFEDIEYD